MRTLAYLGTESLAFLCLGDGLTTVGSSPFCSSGRARVSRLHGHQVPPAHTPCSSYLSVAGTKHLTRKAAYGRKGLISAHSLEGKCRHDRESMAEQAAGASPLVTSAGRKSLE